jgi:putative transposase
LGETLDDCARKYKGFCQQYQPKAKSKKRFFWGDILLPKLTKAPPKSGEKKTKNPQKKDEEAQRFWELWLENNPEIMAVAEKFIFASGGWEQKLPGYESRYSGVGKPMC